MTDLSSYSDDQLNQLAANGYVPIPVAATTAQSQTVTPVVSANGNLSSVPDDQLAAMATHGYVPAAPQQSGFTPQPQNGDWANYSTPRQMVANAATGVINTTAGIPALPDTLLRYADKTGQWVDNKVREYAPSLANNQPQQPYAPSPFVQTADTYLPTQEGMEKLAYGGITKAGNALFNDPAGNVQPYVPQSLAGDIGQSLAGAVGGGGFNLAKGAKTIGEAASSLAPLITAVTTGTVSGKMFPNNPLAPLVGAAFGGKVGQVAADAPSAVAALKNQTSPAEQAVAQDLTSQSGLPSDQLAQQIQATKPTLSGVDPQTGAPLETTLTTGQQTGNVGLLNSEYANSSALAAAKQNMAKINNQVLDQKLQGVLDAATPAPDATIPQTVGNSGVVQATRALGDGLTPNDAGDAVRASLQQNYDAALTNRQAAFQPYEDAVKNSSATVDLDPVVQRLNDQIAGSSGERLAALQRAKDQFTPPAAAVPATLPAASTATILDASGQPVSSIAEQGLGPTNINHAQQVLENLNDVAGTFKPGSKQQGAVLGIKADLAQHLQDNASEVMARNNAYAALSQPVDIYKNLQAQTGAVAKALATDQYGKYDLAASSTLPDSFLTGKAVPEKLDAFVQAHGGDPASLAPLQQHITGQIKGSAINDNGSLNPAALNKITSRYSDALDYMPNYKAKIQSLQAAHDLQQSQQTTENAAATTNQAKVDLLNKLNRSFRSGEFDPTGSPMLTPAFGKYVRQNDTQLRQVLGDTHTDQLQQIGSFLDKQNQSVFSKAPGTSGTGQQTAIAADGHNVVSAIWKENLGRAIGALAGAVHPGIGRITSEIGSTVATLGVMKQQQLAEAKAAIMTRAQTDPQFAADLVTKYNPKLATPTQIAAYQRVSAKIGLVPSITNNPAQGVNNGP